MGVAWLRIVHPGFPYVLPYGHRYSSIISVIRPGPFPSDHRFRRDPALWQEFTLQHNDGTIQTEPARINSGRGLRSWRGGVVPSDPGGRNVGLQPALASTAASPPRHRYDPARPNRSRKKTRTIFVPEHSGQLVSPEWTGGSHFTRRNLRFCISSETTVASRCAHRASSDKGARPSPAAPAIRVRTNRRQLLRQIR